MSNQQHSQVSMRKTYTGSVKNVYQDTQNPQVNYFEFTDDYSIFDWGKMPDTIAQKGRALSILGGYLFQQLANPKSWIELGKTSSLKPFESAFLTTLFSSTTYQELLNKGLQHHFLGWSSETGEVLSFAQACEYDKSAFLKVQAIEVNHPAAFFMDKQTVYDYSFVRTKPFLVPLEVVFRFGMPQGSSLKQRLEQDALYYETLGLSRPPQENQWFERPVVEFFTKLEPTDRFLTPQEAFLISGLSKEAFKTLYETTLLLALWLFDFFARREIALWDGKFEFAWTSTGLMLVDSIGPDELRLIQGEVHLSKEMIRQFYRGTPWEKAVKQAKALASSLPGSDWKAICKDQLGETPEPLNEVQKRITDNLYGALVNHCLEKTVIQTPLSLNAIVSEIQDLQQLEGVR